MQNDKSDMGKAGFYVFSEQEAATMGSAMLFTVAILLGESDAAELMLRTLAPARDRVVDILTRVVLEMQAKQMPEAFKNAKS